MDSLFSRSNEWVLIAWMTWCALSNPFMCKLKVHLGKQISLLSLAALVTDLLSRKHVLSHEVFDLLENSLTFSCLEEQTAFCRTCERPGKKHISHVRKSTGNIGSSSWLPNSKCCWIKFSQQVESIGFLAYNNTKFRQYSIDNRMFGLSNADYNY